MKKNVEAIMAMEMIQKEMAQQSCGGRKASFGSETGFVDDIGAPMVESVAADLMCKLTSRSREVS